MKNSSFKLTRLDRNNVKIVLDVEGLKNAEETFEQIFPTLSKLKKGKNLNVQILCLLNNAYIEDNDNVLCLKKWAEICQKNDFELKICDCDEEEFIDSDIFITAKEKVNEITNKIQEISTKNNLSVTEKLLLTYQVAGNFIYKHENKENIYSCRTAFAGLIGDEIVCAGFAAFFKYLCDKVFDKKEVQCFKHTCKVGESFHGNNFIKIKDTKNNISGLFYCDVTWDSIHKTKRYVLANHSDKPSINYFMLSLADAQKRIGFKSDSIIYNLPQSRNIFKAYLFDDETCEMFKSIGIDTDFYFNFEQQQSNEHDKEDDKIYKELVNKEIDSETFKKEYFELRDKFSDDKLKKIRNEHFEDDIMYIKQRMQANTPIPEEILRNGLFAFAEYIGMDPEAEETNDFVIEKLKERNVRKQMVRESRGL